MPQITLVRTDSDIERAHAVMTQLRPHVPLEGFVDRVRRMEREGFQLAFLEDAGEVAAVAGFRVMDQLVAGRVLYVDDLVTDENARSLGHGAALLDWLRKHAKNSGCTFLELDSGVQRAGAHRFYFREGMAIVGYHFRSESLQAP